MFSIFTLPGGFVKNRCNSLRKTAHLACQFVNLIACRFPGQLFLAKCAACRVLCDMTSASAVDASERPEVAAAQAASDFTHSGESHSRRLIMAVAGGALATAPATCPLPTGGRWASERSDTSACRGRQRRQRRQRQGWRRTTSSVFAEALRGSCRAKSRSLLDCERLLFYFVAAYHHCLNASPGKIKAEPHHLEAFGLVILV